jgi:CheY-like chemotaxis protein
MMADLSSAGLHAALRAAARLNEERFLLGVASRSEGGRIGAILATEGTVVDAESSRAAVDRLVSESFELAVLEQGGLGSFDPLASAKEVRPFTDYVLLGDGDPLRGGDAFAREAAALLPRPLPAADALLRAHLRWLVSCRRSRTRGLMLRNALARHRGEIEATDPALAAAVSDVLNGADLEPTVLVMGDAELVRVAGGRPVQSAPDVVVVALTASDRAEPRLKEARGRAAGAGLVVVDTASTPERLGAAVYAGVRAYLDRAQLAALGRVVAIAASRRRAELIGRRLVETLGRFGVLEDGGRPSPAPPRDVDARLIADATASSAAFVPSGHEVLVVDDEVVVLTVLREALRRGGYTVTTAASAEEAIDLLRRRRFDLVLTDKNLPGASGLEVLRVARGIVPPPAVVLITGYSSYDSAKEALDIGAHDYIEKPIRDLDNLRFRIRRALSRRDEQLSRTQPPRQASAQAKVLLVEVAGDRRRLMAEFLGRSFTVTAVADGDEALRLLQTERFEVVLADRNLPGMSGLRVIEQAQRLLPHCASVLYTAYPSFATVQEAFDLGVDAFLVRPSDDLRSLAEKITNALQGRGGILLG